MKIIKFDQRSILDVRDIYTGFYSFEQAIPPTS